MELVKKKGHEGHASVFQEVKLASKVKLFQISLRSSLLFLLKNFTKFLAKIGKLEYLPAPLFKVIGVMKITTVINRGSVDPAEHYP